MFQNQYNNGRSISILNEVLGSIRLNEGLIRENNQILHEILTSLLTKMKEVDQLFSILYQEPYYTGSYYSDLRISKPDEFDINLLLKLPFREYEFQITHHPSEHGFVKYKLTIPFQYQYQLDYHVLKQYQLIYRFFENDFLVTENVRTWFQSVIDKALISYRPRMCRRVISREAGPARNITIIKNDGTRIDVDLVPVIGCTLNLERNYLDPIVEAKVGSNLVGFLIPKPPHPLADQSTAGRYVSLFEMTEAKRLWKAYFPESDQTILYNVGCAKSVIRLLKKLRDKEKWSVLASYYLKTVVMWMIVENSRQPDYWRQDKIAERFIEALQKLAGFVQRRNIPFIFNTACNLIAKMSFQEANNIYNRLMYFIRFINIDPNNFRAILT